MTFVLPVSELPPGSRRRVRVGGRTLALWHTSQGIYATDDTCTHERASLSEGDFEPEAGVVACPEHGARFDVRSGKALTLPAYKPLRTYPVEVHDGRIAVRLEG
ncbi:MAG: non-heme iron oxygenase ferredoxin subunit [Firmicutes bacterium]|nr:non-heme iron oxygenase ferredoxin subunit [Bacillota bacterium]